MPRGRERCPSVLAAGTDAGDCAPEAGVSGDRDSYVRDRASRRCNGSSRRLPMKHVGGQSVPLGSLRVSVTIRRAVIRVLPRLSRMTTSTA